MPELVILQKVIDIPQITPAADTVARRSAAAGAPVGIGHRDDPVARQLRRQTTDDDIIYRLIVNAVRKSTIGRREDIVKGMLIQLQLALAAEGIIR